MTAPAATGGISNAYTAALLEARATGYRLGAEGVARLRRAFGLAVVQLEAELLAASDADRPVVAARAEALRRQILGVLARLERQIAEVSLSTATTTRSEVVAIHREVNLDLARRYAPSLEDKFAARYDQLNVGAAAVIAARPANAATFRTLARRNVQDAAPALDALLTSAIARGVSTRRLTKDVAALLAGGTTDLKTYGLEPSNVSGLKTLLYDARRIAITETNNALREANRAGLVASPIVKAVKWQLSGRHRAIYPLPQRDVCDDLAEGNDPADIAELGPLPPGYYSPKRFPLGAHPFCMCVQGGPTIFYRPSEWAARLGRGVPKPPKPDPGPTDAALVAEAKGMLRSGLTAGAVRKDLRGKYPSVDRARIAAAVAQAEKELAAEGPTDAQLEDFALSYLRVEGEFATRAGARSATRGKFPGVAEDRVVDAVERAWKRFQAERPQVTDAQLLEEAKTLLRSGREGIDVFNELQRRYPGLTADRARVAVEGARRALQAEHETEIRTYVMTPLVVKAYERGETPNPDAIVRAVQPSYPWADPAWLRALAVEVIAVEKPGAFGIDEDRIRSTTRYVLANRFGIRFRPATPAEMAALLPKVTDWVIRGLATNPDRDIVETIVEEEINRLPVRVVTEVRPEDRAAGEAMRRDLEGIKARENASLDVLQAERERLLGFVREIDAAFGTRVLTAEERAEFSAKVAAARAELAPVEAEMARIRNEARLEALERISLPASERVPVRAHFTQTPRDPLERAKFDRAFDIVSRLVPREILASMEVEVHRLRRGARAHQNGRAQIHIAPDNGFDVIVHEIGHVLESHRPDVLRSTTAWRDARARAAGDARPVGLRTLYPGHGYSSSEKAWKDEFKRTSFYVGKVYQSANGTDYASEVVSMGLEMLARDAAHFAATDPDYFDFIVGLLRAAARATREAGATP